MAYDIFISYRRTDRDGLNSGTYIARTIKQELELEGYQDRVFFDYSELSDNEFEDVILGAIKQCKIFVLVLSKDSMMRCVNEGDWVRREILHAQECGLKIIPIEPDNLFNGYPEGFPKELDVVKKTQHTRVHTDSSFERDIQAMIKTRISPILPPKKIPAAYGALVRIDCDIACRIFCFGKSMGHTRKGITEIRLSKGLQKLSFIGVESDAEHYECELDVRDLEYAYYIKVSLLEAYNARKKREEELRIARLIAAGKGRDGVYQAGDYYKSDDKEGVVFWVDETGTHGKIISLDQASLQWCTDKQFALAISTKATNEQEGIKNTNRVMRRSDYEEYPAFTWCRNKGKEWYLPTVAELKTLSENCEAVNATLEKREATKIKKGFFSSDGYWSSQEKSHKTDYSACFVWMFGGGVNDAVKSERYNVRAVSKF